MYHFLQHFQLLHNFKMYFVTTVPSNFTCNDYLQRKIKSNASSLKGSMDLHAYSLCSVKDTS